MSVAEKGPVDRFREFAAQVSPPPTSLLATNGEATTLPVLDPATMCVTGEVEVDAGLAVPVPAEQPDEHAQRLPTPNDRPAIVDLVLARLRSPKARAVIEQRDAIGRARYGTRLQAFNGRDVERDMTDEAADAVNYAMQGIQEAPDDAARAKWGRRFAMAKALLEEMVGEETAPGEAPGFDLDYARGVLARTKRTANPDHQDDLWVELREACNEVERLRPMAHFRS